MWWRSADGASAEWSKSPAIHTYPRRSRPNYLELLGRVGIENKGNVSDSNLRSSLPYTTRLLPPFPSASFLVFQLNMNIENRTESHTPVGLTTHTYMQLPLHLHIAIAQLIGELKKCIVNCHQKKNQVGILDRDLGIFCLSYF